MVASIILKRRPNVVTKGQASSSTYSKQSAIPMTGKHTSSRFSVGKAAIGGSHKQLLILENSDKHDQIKLVTWLQKVDDGQLASSA